MGKAFIIVFFILAACNNKNAVQNRQNDRTPYYDDNRVVAKKKIHLVKYMGRLIRYVVFENDLVQNYMISLSKFSFLRKMVFDPLLRLLFEKKIDSVVDKIDPKNFMCGDIDAQHPLTGTNILKARKYMESTLKHYMIKKKVADNKDSLIEILVGKDSSSLYRVDYGLNIKIGNQIFGFSFYLLGSDYTISSFDLSHVLESLKN